MSNETLTLTKADINAVNLKDAGYINNRGAKFYTDGEYKTAVEYYRLAAVMGDMNAVSNLGYCYLYGRDIEQNTSLAIAYFKIAAEHGNIDAAYKLGDIYSRDKRGMMDIDLSLYYYNIAACIATDGDFNIDAVIYSDKLCKYPSLCYALGREMSYGGRMNTDIKLAYSFLKHAQAGYKAELDNGAVMYKTAYEGVNKLLKDPQFDRIRKECDDLFADIYHNF